MSYQIINLGSVDPRLSEILKLLETHDGVIVECDGRPVAFGVAHDNRAELIDWLDDLKDVRAIRPIAEEYERDPSTLTELADAFAAPSTRGRGERARR